MRVLELFSGIGGCAASLPRGATVVAAVDQSAPARATYRRNFPDHPLFAWNLSGLKAERVARLEVDLWWMSPPCQPFTSRGLQRDVDDPRCRPLLRLVELLGSLRPPMLAFENVPAFPGSRAHGLLVQQLTRCGYQHRSGLLCPTDLGVPNRRSRFYLVAVRKGLGELRGASSSKAWDCQATPAGPAASGNLATYLDEDPDSELYLDPALVDRYRHALSVAEPGSQVPLPCFTAGYGHSITRSGGFLRDGRGVRRFSPEEVLQLLGFPPAFSFPPELETRSRWRLAGNSLSVVAVRRVLEALPLPSAGPAISPPSPAP